jgi:hypothetical protein
MKSAPLVLAVIGSPLATPVSKHVPGLNIEALCKPRSEAGKFMRTPESQRVADCVRDESAAKQTLAQ